MRLPFTQASDFHRERDFSQKISATTEFMVSHWRQLGKILAYIVLPAALVRSVLTILVQQKLPISIVHNADEGAADRLLSTYRAVYVSPTYWLNSLIGSISFAFMLLSVYGYVMVLAQRHTPGPPVTVTEVWEVVKREFLGTLFSLWGVGLLIGAGFLVLFVPGFYLSVALSLFFIVKLSEGTGFGATLSRCLSLVRGKWWSTFGLIFICIVLLYVVLIGAGAVAVAVSGGFASAFQAMRARSPLVSVVISSITSIATLLLYPPLLLALAFQYFNLVERREGAGLRLMVESLGQTAAPVVSNAAYRPDEEGEY